MVASLKEIIPKLNKISEIAEEQITFDKIDLSRLTTSDHTLIEQTIDQIDSLDSNDQKKIGNHKLWFYLGRLLDKKQDYLRAENCYRLSLLFDQTNAKVWYNLGTILSDSSTQEECYRKAVKYNPTDSDTWNALGSIVMEKNEKESCYRKVIELNPDNSEGWNVLGTVVEDKDEQERYYRKAIELDPNNSFAWNNLGTVVEDKAEQECCYRKAIELDPENPNPWNNLGTVVDDKTEKKRCFRKAIELNPDYAQAWNNLGNMVEDKDEQERCYRKADELGYIREESISLIDKNLDELNTKIKEIRCESEKIRFSIEMKKEVDAAKKKKDAATKMKWVCILLVIIIILSGLNLAFIGLIFILCPLFKGDEDQHHDQIAKNNEFFEEIKTLEEAYNKRKKIEEDLIEILKYRYRLKNADNFQSFTNAYDGRLTSLSATHMKDLEHQQIQSIFSFITKLDDNNYFDLILVFFESLNYSDAQIQKWKVWPLIKEKAQQAQVIIVDISNQISDGLGKLWDDLVHLHPNPDLITTISNNVKKIHNRKILIRIQKLIDDVNHIFEFFNQFATQNQKSLIDHQKVLQNINSLIEEIRKILPDFIKNWIKSEYPKFPSEILAKLGKTNPNRFTISDSSVLSQRRITIDNELKQKIVLLNDEIKNALIQANEKDRQVQWIEAGNLISAVRSKTKMLGDKLIIQKLNDAEIKFQKKPVLKEISTRYPRIHRLELEELLHLKYDKISPIIEDMVQKGQISARYFDSTEVILFETKTSKNVANEIQSYPQQSSVITGETNSNFPRNQTVKSNITISDFRQAETSIQTRIDLKNGNTIDFQNHRYSILDKLGQGGMGAVYLARNQVNGTICAIKEFFTDKYSNADRTQNDCEEYWERERRIMEIQSGSPVPAIKLIGSLKNDKCDPPQYFLLMDYVFGTTLQKWIDKCRIEKETLNLEKIIHEILIPLAKHLAFTHDHGIIHRDITPNNIMITEDKGTLTPYLIDWGVAKELPVERMFSPKKPYFTSTTTAATSITSVGNPPEVLFGLNPVAASDIYMFGYICIFLFTHGQIIPPQKLLQPKIDLTEFLPKMPYAIVKLIEQMLQFEPADRIGTFGEIERKLEQI